MAGLGTARAKSAIWYWPVGGAKLALRVESEIGGVDSENLGSKSVPLGSVLDFRFQYSPMGVKSALLILGLIWLLESNQLFSFYSAQLRVS